MKANSRRQRINFFFSLVNLLLFVNKHLKFMRKLLLSTTLLVLYTALAQGQRAVSAANWQQHCVDLKFDDASGQLLFGRIPEHRYVAAAEFPRWFCRNGNLR